MVTEVVLFRAAVQHLSQCYSLRSCDKDERNGKRTEEGKNGEEKESKRRRNVNKWLFKIASL